ncbi:Rv0361 family membrane protein [Rhodococcoides kroppenstedtii]|uniref:Rv0361 family membrane protein n=1 Tax=Rhodococcoides kroppenstedtii TaxID=293050 RepID=UPI001427DEAC|nr:hypothetical protein [Rhodococcus kroppenstedtii]NIL80500.1 hypothetical protein [Rhodococcus kroppenstedtii]
MQSSTTPVGDERACTAVGTVKVKLRGVSPSTPPPARPQYIPPREPAREPRTRRPIGRWVAALVIAALVVVGGVVAFALLRGGTTATGASDEDRIRVAIDDFTTALRDGDLAGLRAGTCGPLASFYGGISDEDFAATHDAAVASGSIPEILSVDTIQITPAEAPDVTTAIAQVTARGGNETAPSPRTFDLALEDETWKVCA